MALKTVAPGHFFIPAAPSKGTAVAQSASANTFGGYVELEDSTAEALYITGYFVDVLIDVNSVAPLYVDLNIGVGAAASEVTVDQARMPTIYAAGGAGTNNLRFGAFVPVIPPIPVAASARIAVKTASDFASAIAWNVSLQCIAQADVVDAGVNESADVQTIKTQAVTCSAGVTVGAFVGNATAALGVDASGRVDLGKWIGVAPLALTSQQVQAVVPDSQKVDVNTIKTNPVVNGGTITFPTGATLASTTNITAGTITTVTNLTNAPTNGDLTAAMKASVNAECDTALADYDGPTNAEMVARTIAAADYATAANLATVAGYIDTEIAGIISTLGVAGAGLTALGDTRLANLDATVSSRLADADYTAPTNLTAAQIATGVWTDTTAGDFTVALSIGKSIMNGVALGTGLTINGYTGNTPQTGDSFARIGAAGAGLTAVPWNAAWDAEVQSECTDALVAYDPPTNAEMEARTLVAAGYATAADLATVAGYLDTEIAAILEDTGTTLPAQIAALNNIAAADVWAVATRVLTAGTNIVLAKGTGITGFNDLSAAQVNAECDTALADYDPPTNTEMVARTLASADYATAANLATVAAYLDTEIAAILEDTGTTLPAQIAALNNIAAADVWAVVTRTLTAGTNIVLAKGTGVTGFNDLSAAQVNAECDTALADYDGPTNAEMVARTIAAADYGTSANQNTINNNVVNSMSLITAIPANITSDHGAGSYVRNTEPPSAVAIADQITADHGSGSYVPDNINITAIKAKTDSITFTVASVIDANVRYVNNAQISGSGTTGSPWGPA